MKIHFPKLKFPTYPKSVQVLFLFYILGFTIGTISHVIALIQHGVIIYESAPLWKNIYWTCLTFLDFAVIILIIYSVIPALVLSNLIIISDAIINSLGVNFVGFDFAVYYRLVFQIIFMVFVVITTPVILRKYIH